MPDPSDATPSLPAVLDPEAQKRFLSSFPMPYSTLPSLAKPQASALAPVTTAANGMPPVRTSDATSKPQLSAVIPPASALPPVTAPNPSPEEQRVASVRAKLQKLENTPSFTEALWNKTKGSDSVIGKIGHIGAGILRGVDIAGETLMPNVARNIPGSILNRNQQIATAQQGLKQAETEAGQASERRYRSAEADKASADATKARRETDLLGQPKPKEEDYSVESGRSGPHGESVLLEKTSGAERYGLPSTPTKTPSETATQHKMDMEAIGATAGVTGNPKTEKAEINAARQAGKITDQQARDYLAFRNVEGTQGSKIDVTVAGQQSAEGIRRSDRLYAYADENGKTQWAWGNKIPPGAEVMYQIQNPEATVKGAKNLNTVQESFNKLAAHDPSMFDNAGARSVLTTSLDENKARSLGILVAGTGGSLTSPSGSGKIIDQLLQNNAVPQQYRRELKDFIVDYYSFKDKMLALQMNLQNNRIGRLSAPVIEAMFNQLPGVNTSDSYMAKRQIANLASFIREARSDIPDEYGSFKKAPESNLPSGSGVGAGIPSFAEWQRSQGGK